MTAVKDQQGIAKGLKKAKELWMEVPGDVRSLVERQNSGLNDKQSVALRTLLGKEYRQMSTSERDRVCHSIKKANDIRLNLQSIVDFTPIKFGMWAFRIANPLTLLLRPLRDQITKIVKVPTTAAIREIQDFPSYAPTWKAMAATSWGLLASSAMVAVGSVLVGLADDPFELSELADSLDGVAGFDLSSVADALRGVDESMEAMADTLSSIPASAWDALIAETWA